MPKPVAKPPHWRPLPLMAGLEGVALMLPTSLACTLLVFVQVGPGYWASGMFATLLGLVLLHLAGLTSGRPILYSARMFEATTLAAMLAQLPLLLPGWGLVDTPELRLAFMCLIGGGAGVVMVLLYALRAHRLTRFIPAPVFSGFSNSIAALLVISQIGTINRLLHEGEPAWTVFLLALLAASVMLATRLRKPKWPAAAVGLALGAAVAQALPWLGHTPVTLASGQLPTTLPLWAADFAPLWAPTAPHMSIVAHLVVQSFILGVMAFVNTNVTEETFAQIDGQRHHSRLSQAFQALTVAVTSLLGSPVLTASQQGSMAALRTHPLTRLTVFWAACWFALSYGSGLLLWMPVAAICGVMLADAWFFVDQGSARSLVAWLRRQPLRPHAREDLALIAAVTVTAVVVNMVVAVVVGIFLGLLLFALRNARKPVRHVWSGQQVRSNCARPRSELAALDAHGGRIRVFELDGDVFFGASRALQEALEQQVTPGQWAVVDWSRARNVDTSVVGAMARMHRHLAARGAQLLHGGIRPGSDVADTMADAVAPSVRFPDLDRALEHAENALLRDLAVQGHDARLLPQEPVDGFLRGLSAVDRERVRAVMRIVHLAPEEVVVRAGDPSDSLMLVISGSARVVVKAADGTEVRLSTVLPGATLGEIGFLDGAPRSANVVATSELQLACLDRHHFDQFSREHPHITQRLLTNLATDVAARLRSVSAMVAARSRA